MKKRKLKALEIVQSGLDRNENHRGDFETCPCCMAKIKMDQWHTYAKVLILDPYCYKAGRVAVMAECPKCFEGSWVHIPMGHWKYSYPEWPEAWWSAVEKREKEVKLSAIRSCAFGLCGKCAKLNEMSVDHHAYRKCAIGYGPSLDECEHFSETKYVKHST